MRTTTNGGNGNYRFTDLRRGGYVVDVNEATLPAGFVFTQPNKGDDNLVSDVQAGAGPVDRGEIARTTLLSAVHDLSWDSAITPLAIDALFGQLMTWRGSSSHYSTDAGEPMGLLEAGLASLTAAITERPELNARGTLQLARSNAMPADDESAGATDASEALRRLAALSREGMHEAMAA